MSLPNEGNKTEWLSPLGLRMARSDGRIHALGRFHIGGVAYLCMGASAHRLYRHVEYPTVADAVIETEKPDALIFLL
jgi:hypothetical protein